MRRVNISNDVASREKIASAIPQTPVAALEPIVTNKTKEDGKTEEVQGGADDTPTGAESDTTPKRGRKTTRDSEKV